ncbi:MAG: peptidoglycan-binding protein [Thermodesulfobacteriota bacterium]
MATHIIKKGECLSSLAERYGFHHPDVLHSHADNSALKAKRDNPNVLCPGDRVAIPDKTPKEESGADGQKHRFKAKGIRTHLRLLVEDVAGTALAGRPYTLEVGREEFTGTTGGDGLVEHLVTAAETRGRLTVWLDDAKTSSLVWPLEIGALEPHTETRGLQARLNNLGFTCGKADGIVGPKTKAAVRAFKQKNGLADNDTIDDATKNKIKEVYGF